MGKAKNRVVWCNQGWQPVSYGFCPNKKAWDREMKRMGVKEPYPHPDGAGGRLTDFEHSDGSRCAIITVCEKAAKGRGHVEIAGILAHEGAHVWQLIRDHIGEKTPSSEFEAYAMQFIVMELLKAYQMTRGMPRK